MTCPKLATEAVRFFKGGTSLLPALAFSAVVFSTPVLAQPPASAPAKASPASPPSASPVQPGASASPQSNSSAQPVVPPVGSAKAETQTLSVPAKNLMAQRLHPASFPREAEIRCGTLEPCAMGLTRGFVVGGDLSRLISTSFLGQFLYKSGTWFFYDAFAGFQFLQQVDNKIFANGSVGYRGFSYENSDGRKVSTKGFTFKVAYGQEINPVYTQGLVFSLFPSRVSVTGDKAEQDAQNRGGELPGVSKAFYEYSRKHPRVSLYFPADLEVINWKASHVDLPNHVRSYVKVAPFYIQNDFVLQDTYSMTEKNFGLRLGATTTYESVQEKSGRYAFLGSFGVDVAASDQKSEDQRANRSSGIKVDNILLPKRPVFDFYVNLEASYQF